MPSNPQPESFSRLSDGARRNFLRVLGVSAVLVWPGFVRLAQAATEQPPGTLSPALSALCGIEFTDETQAQTYLNALRAQIGDKGVATLLSAVKLPGADLLKSSLVEPLRPLAEQAMSLWLTGLSHSHAAGETPSMIDYAGAGVWRAIPFTKPPGYCGGPFGYWADPPAAA